MKIGNQICISRLDKMGDMILSLPAIKAIKIANPNIKITILAAKENTELLKELDYIDNFTFINTNISFFNFLKNIFIVRKQKYDLFLNLSPTLLSYVCCFFSKAEKKGTLIFLSRYRKTFFSKLIIRLLSRLYCHYVYIINRYYLLKNDKEIHQTKMIFNLMKMCNISFDSNTNINISLPKNKLNITSANKSLVTIHLSNKWINKHYSEENFFELIANLPTKKYTYILTTDDYTNHKFKKIYKRFQIISDNKLHKINLLDRDFTIFDKPNFENWKQIIYSSNLIITPECGCSHMASACRIPVIIIYDAENYPEAIYKEYHPWKSKHEKLVFNYESLNEKIVNNLT